MTRKNRAGLILMAAASALAVVSSTPAFAFDVDGFKSGLALSDVQRIISKRGWNLEPASIVGGDENSYVMTRVDAKSREREFGGLTLSFCGKRLMSYERDLKFNREGYVATVASLTQKYGTSPKVEAVVPLGLHGPAGFQGSVRMTWTVNNETVTVSVIPPETVNSQVSSPEQLYAPTIWVKYIDRLACSM